MKKAPSFFRSKRSCRFTLFAGVCLALTPSFLVLARAQSPALANLSSSSALPDAPEPQTIDSDSPVQPDEVKVSETPRNILHDQAAILTSPVHLRPHDLKWLFPVTLATGAAIATDHRVLSQVVSRNPSFNDNNITTSNVLIGGMVATPVLLFASGQLGHNEHARETGILGGEAMVNGLIAEQVMKLVFWRERPYVDSGRGTFFKSAAGIDSSFPSAHSTIAWAAAASIAAEYRSPWTQIAVYGAATGVSLTRVLGQEHFPSDVLVGATTGWLIGHYVVRHHHHVSLSEHISHR